MNRPFTSSIPYAPLRTAASIKESITEPNDLSSVQLAHPTGHLGTGTGTGGSSMASSHRTTYAYAPLATSVPTTTTTTAKPAGSNQWEDLRRQARLHENEIDSMLVKFSKLCMNYTSGASARIYHSGGQAGDQSVLVSRVNCDQVCPSFLVLTFPIAFYKFMLPFLGGEEARGTGR